MIELEEKIEEYNELLMELADKAVELDKDLGDEWDKLDPIKAEIKALALLI